MRSRLSPLKRSKCIESYPTSRSTSLTKNSVGVGRARFRVYCFSVRMKSLGMVSKIEPQEAHYWNRMFTAIIILKKSQMKESVSPLREQTNWYWV